MTENQSLEGVDFKEGYIAIIDKPLEWTSTDVVRKIKYALQHRLGPERPLRDVFIRDVRVLDAKQLGVMRDVSSFIVLDSEVHTPVTTLSKSDGLEGVMFIDTNLGE